MDISEPVDEELEQLHLNSVDIVASFEHSHDIQDRYIHGPNISKEGILRKSLDFRKLT